jgi:ubiquinone/menaquinone biosynthesis C-methylase UbiE
MPTPRKETHMSQNKPPGAGKSSFDLVDPQAVFQTLGLTSSTVFLDLGCGPGDYLLAADELIGPKGKLYGVDAWEEGVDRLRKKILRKDFNNVEVFLSDVTKSVPLPDSSVDICLMGTVLHDFARDGGEQGALRETARMLKVGGIFGIVEFKKIEGPPGPPIHIRLSQEEVESMIKPFGFSPTRSVDTGPFTYMIVASKMSVLVGHGDRRIKTNG